MGKYSVLTEAMKRLVDLFSVEYNGNRFVLLENTKMLFSYIIHVLIQIDDKNHQIELCGCKVTKCTTG